MKKRIIGAGILAGILVAGVMLGACSAKKGETTATENTGEVQETQESTSQKAVESDGRLKTGLGIVTDISNSKNASETQNGLAQADSIAAALLLDGNGTIIDVDLDTVQTKVEFTPQGKLVTAIDTNFKTGKEIGADYGMKSVSTIGKEWYEQIDALENYVKGKTIEEVKGIKLSSENTAEEVDLNSSVTIKIDKYIEAMAKAAETAQSSDAVKEDKLGLAIRSTIDGSKDFDNGDEGIAKIDNFYAAVTVSDEGKVTSAFIDGLNTEISFDDIGEITADYEEDIKTKLELADTYGMKSASSISKEWDEQAKAISEYVIGKTAQDIIAIEVADDGKAKGTDLVSKATVAIDPFKSILEKAIGSAK